MKRANGTMLAFICLLGLVFCVGATAAKLDSQQLKALYDRMRVQQDALISGNVPIGPFKAATTYLLISDTTLNWDGEAWGNSDRTTYTYDAQNKMTEILAETYVGTDWQNSERTLITYNGSNTGTWLLEEWNSSDTRWDTTIFSAYTYYGADSIVIILMGYINNALSDSTKQVQYYSADRVDSLVSKLWQVSIWENTSKISYTYDGSGNMTMWLSQIWVLNWQNQQRDSMVYVDGHDTLSVIQNWVSNAWENVNKNRYMYDGGGDLIVDLYYTWSESAWDSAGKDEYTYDANHNQILDMVSQWHTTQWDTTEKTVSIYQASLAVPIGSENIPHTFELKQNYPNPFNPSTVIGYSLSQRSMVEINVFNVLGQKIRTLENGWQPAGVYQTTWDGNDFSGRSVSTGVYFYQIKAGEFSQTRKMVLMK